MRSKQKVQSVAIFLTFACFAVVTWLTPSGHAQLPDKTVTPNTSGVGINKTFVQHRPGTLQHELNSH